MTCLLLADLRPRPQEAAGAGGGQFRNVEGALHTQGRGRSLLGQGTDRTSLVGSAG